uniref:p11 protein n=1 Tax=Schistosoma japonicum TaxID=6182 RepID=D5FFY9_SCHJA|nr:P11 protein [Schistosoma japonicum]
MVTAVQPAFGLLKRLHLHPMENALNELGPQASLLQSVKFKAQPFLFRKPKSEEIRRDHNITGQKRPSSYLPNLDLKTAKRPRRVVKSTDKNLVLMGVNLRSSCENPTVRCPTSSPRVTSSNLSLFQSSISISPSNLSESNVSCSQCCVNYSEPPLLHPKYLCPQNSLLQNYQHRSQVTSIISTAPTECQARFTKNKTDSVSDENQFVMESASSASPICTRDFFHLNEVISHFSGQNPMDTRYLNYSFITRRSSPVSSVPRKPDSLDDDKCDVKMKNRKKSLSEHNDPPKRRKSIDQLTEPSIHGLPDPEISTKPRSRKPTQFLQLNAQTTELSSNDRKPTYLTTQLCYYIPDFANHFQSSENIRVHLSESNKSQEVCDSGVLIEVPSWRIIPIPCAENYLGCSFGTKHSKSYCRKHLVRNKLTYINTPKSHNLRTLRTSLLSTSSVYSIKNDPTPEPKSKHRPRLSQTQKSRSQIGEFIRSDDIVDEDISDTAFLARHSRLEIEEVRHERFSRQRTAEQELKQRLEERDQASWRQPGRLDPLLKYKPASRMPTTLNYAFKQSHHFHVNNSIPVVVFGCRVPMASLKPFTKFSIQ